MGACLRGVGVWHVRQGAQRKGPGDRCAWYLAGRLRASACLYMPCMQKDGVDGAVRSSPNALHDPAPHTPIIRLWAHYRPARCTPLLRTAPLPMSLPRPSLELAESLSPRSPHLGRSSPAYHQQKGELQYHNYQSIALKQLVLGQGGSGYSSAAILMYLRGTLLSRCLPAGPTTASCTTP